MDKKNSRLNNAVKRLKDNQSRVKEQSNKRNKKRVPTHNKGVNYGKIKPYLDRGLTIEQIAEQFECSKQTIHYHIQKFKKGLKASQKEENPKKAEVKKETAEVLLEVLPYNNKDKIDYDAISRKDEVELKNFTKKQAKEFVARKFALKRKAVEIAEELLGSRDIITVERLRMAIALILGK